MHDLVRRTRVLTACVAVALLTVSPAAAQDDLEDWQRAELRSMLEAIEAALDGRIVPDGDPFEFRADFLKGTDGNAYVPFTLSIDADKVDTSTVSMYLFVVEPGDTDAIFEDAYFADVASGGDEPIRLSRAFAAPGGAYDVYIALRESSRDLAPESDPPGDRDRAQIDEYCGGLFPNDLGSRFACQEQEYLAYRLQRRPRLSFDASEESAAMMMLRARVDVPDLWNGRLQLSSIIVPEVVEPMAAPLTPEQQILSPYSLGTTRIVPKFDQDFGKQAELSLIFLVYNPGAGRPIEAGHHHRVHLSSAGGWRRGVLQPDQSAGVQRPDAAARLRRDARPPDRGGADRAAVALSGPGTTGWRSRSPTTRTRRSLSRT